MPGERTNEDDVFNLDDWGDDDVNEEELEDDSEDTEFDTSKLSASERKRYEKMRQEVESSVIEALAKGDTKSPVYKGLQRVIASKDRDLAETRNALAAVINNVQQLNDKSADGEFLQNILKEMLDEDSKKVFEQKFNQHQQTKKQTQTEQMLQQLLRGQQQQFQPQVYPYGQPREEVDEQLKQYRKDGEARLKAFVKRMRIDPDNPKLDYGDEEEPLVERMTKLNASIERLTDEQDEESIDRVRAKGTRPRTNTDSPGSRPKAEQGVRLLEQASASMLDKMRKL